MLTVLSIAFPFAPVTEDPVGGAEQVLARLDEALVAAGHRSIVIAAEGSRVRGALVTVPHAAGTIDGPRRPAVHAAVRSAIAAVLAREAVDLVHLHGLDFDAYLPPVGHPTLVTLHLPLGWYRRDALRPGRPLTWLHTVSPSQARSAPADLELLAPIENGIEIERFAIRVAKERFALVLGRICPEKGFREAIDAAVRADVPLVIAGRVFPCVEHQHYYAQEMLPRLDSSRRWIGEITGGRKRWLLAAARCVLVPSLAPETSSLVAMEALAAGTPVIAFRAGALPDLVEHGRTGYIVDDVPSMADAIARVDGIDPETCRRTARARFALQRMTTAYLDAYRSLVATGTARPGALAC